jgi:hypothetical protein
METLPVAKKTDCFFIGRWLAGFSRRRPTNMLKRDKMHEHYFEFLQSSRHTYKALENRRGLFRQDSGVDTLAKYQQTDGHIN